MSVTLTVQELRETKERLESLLGWVDGLLKSVREPEIPVAEKPVRRASVSKVSKLKTLGVCMFVNKRILKEQGIDSRESLETCSQRCTSKAVHLKNGLIVCGRHKDSDTSKIEDIVNHGIRPDIRTVDLTETEDSPLKPGKYGSRKLAPRDSSSEEYVAAAIDECTRLEELLEETDRTLLVKIDLKELLAVQYEDVRYVIDPMGDCFGKITDEEAVTALEMKMKMKEFGLIGPHLQPLKGVKDRTFLEKFSLEYSLQYLN